MRDTKHTSPLLYCSGGIATHQRNFDAGLLYELDALAVPDVKLFNFFSALGVVQAAIGEHTVDVQDQELDVRQARTYIIRQGAGHWNCTGGVASRAARRLSTCCNRASSWARGTIFGPSLSAWSGVSWISINRASTPTA